MKKKSSFQLCSVIFAVALLSISATAAIPAKPKEMEKGKSLGHALEILQMPEENRKLLAQAEPPSFYESLMTIAFDDQRPMSLRWKALMLGADLHKKDSIEDLVKASKNPQWFMRNAALVAIKDLDPATAEDMAKTLIKDKALVVRSAAVELLAKSKSSSVREILWKELQEKYNFKNQASLWIRPQIIESLAVEPRPQEMARFAQLLNEKEDRIQKISVVALEKLSGKVLGEKKTTLQKKVALWKKEIDSN